MWFQGELIVALGYEAWLSANAFNKLTSITILLVASLIYPGGIDGTRTRGLRRDRPAL